MNQIAIENVAPGVWRYRFGEPERISPVSITTSRPRIAAMQNLPECPVPRWASDELDFAVSARGSTIAIPLASNEGIFGLGLQLKSHLQNGKKKTLRVNSDPVADTGDSHAPVPFYCSTDGYGVLVDTCRYASFYFGTHVPATGIARRHIEKQGELATTTHELYRPRHAGDRVVIDVPTSQGVDVYLFAGPTLQSAVQRYNLFSGGGVLPPLWSLGNWYRCSSNVNADEVLAMAERLRAEKMPMDVIGLEPGWQTAAYPCTFVFSPDRFPDPQAMIDRMTKLGYRINLWEHAFVHPASPLAGDITGRCGDQLAFDGLVPDFLDPVAADLFANHHDENLVSLGISSFKLDECDNSDFIRSPWSFPEWSRFPSGADGEQMHSLLGVLYQRTIDSVFKARRQAHFSLVRSSHALAAPLPFALYSDLYDFDDFVRGLTNSGFCGLLWCPELRDASSIDDLVRRVQLVTLSPVSQIDGWYIRNPPWHHMNAAANNAGERMPESERATALVREALRFRMRILPYLYTAFGRYHEDGTPPVRAMVMEEPANRALWECHDQLMIGPDLLAAPVRPGQTSRNVYLPGSSWIDFHTGEVLQGGKQYTVDAPLDRIPLFVRDGAILPLADTEHEDGIERADSLRVAATVFTTGDSARGTVLEPPEDPDQPILPRELVWSRQEGGVCHGPEVLGKRFSISRWQVVKSRGSSSSE